MDFVVDKLGCRSAKDANEQKVHGPTKILHHNQDIENTLNLNLRKIGEIGFSVLIPTENGPRTGGKRNIDQQTGLNVVRRFGPYFFKKKNFFLLTKFLNQNGCSFNSELFSLSGMF